MDLMPIFSVFKGVMVLDVYKRQLLLSSYFPSQIPDRWPVPYSTAVKAFFLLIFIPSPPNIRLIAQYRLLSISDNRSSEHLRIFKNFLKLIFISNILDQQLIPHCSLMLKISRIYYTCLLYTSVSFFCSFFVFLFCFSVLFLLFVVNMFAVSYKAQSVFSDNTGKSPSVSIVMISYIN